MRKNTKTAARCLSYSFYPTWQRNETDNVNANMAMMINLGLVPPLWENSKPQGKHPFHAGIFYPTGNAHHTRNETGRDMQGSIWEDSLLAKLAWLLAPT